LLIRHSKYGAILSKIHFYRLLFFFGNFAHIGNSFTFTTAQGDFDVP